MKRFMIFLWLTLFLVNLEACNKTSPEGLEPSSVPISSRKLIEIGWDIPGAVFVRDHISAMEQKPFNGVVISIKEVGIGSDGYPRNQNVPWAFDTRAWTQSEMKLDVLSAIQWRKFTDNFIWVLGTNYAGMDWFNDSHWNTVQANMHLLGKAIVAGKLKGIFFDPEIYSSDANPWGYSSSRYPGKSFATVEAKVRQRASQLIQALQSEKSDLTFFSMMMSDLIHDAYDNNNGNYFKDDYALLKAFLEGLLDGANSTVRFVEGNEGAYYWDETTKFNIGFDWIGWILGQLSSSRKSKWQNQTTIANAMYPDMVLGHLTPGPTTPFLPDYYSQLSQTDFQKWWEHNVYHSFATSDNYVWMWTEGMDWWETISSGSVFSGLEQGLSTSRSKVQNSQALGFDMFIKASNIFSGDRPRPTRPTSPSVTLSTSKSGSSVTLSASVSGSNIDYVEFYSDGFLVGTDTSAPYTLTLNNQNPGTLVFMARVFNTSYSHGTSAPKQVTF
jgi:Bacterial Ig domain